MLLRVAYQRRRRRQRVWCCRRRFIPAAERYRPDGRHRPLGDSNGVPRLCERHRPDRRRGIAINLSGNSLQRRDPARLHRSRSSPRTASRRSRVCFEITETAAIQNLSHAPPN
ncbi:MAG: hypothetical protein MZV65_35120 [Chromatiales bacterium]|nr:hypothetical protein [Chromatiales bacterium]